MNYEWGNARCSDSLMKILDLAEKEKGLKSQKGKSQRMIHH
jgi:hypothetical protein